MATFIDRVARQLLYLQGFRSLDVPTSVGAVHVFERACPGPLPPVVFFHGFGASATSWTYLLRALRPHVQRILAVDLPAHGFSGVPVDGLTNDSLRVGVLEALDAVQAEPAVVIGNSLGGAAAIRYAGARPDMVLGLCLISPAGAPLGPEDLDQLRAVFRLETHADAVAFVDRLYARQNPLRRALAPIFRARFQDPVLRAWIEEVRPEDQLTAEELAALRVPCKLLWGEQERLLPDHALEFFRLHLPDAEIERPEGHGHSPFLDDPQGLTDRILAFLRRVGGDETPPSPTVLLSSR